jgi:hypothetical protein
MLRFMSSRFPSIKLGAGLILSLGIFLWSCSPAPTPTLFIPPTAPAPLIQPTFIIQPTREAVAQSTPLPTIIPPTDAPTQTPATGECVNSLRFISDLTIPDNSTITYGATIDKQWLVENNGTCHWDSSYRLKFVSGAMLGAPEEIALYPARAGTQATIQILFTAPFTDGIYESAWQAYDPNGNPFGSVIYIRIDVVPP